MSRSDRRSDRAGNQTPEPTEISTPEPISAPESMAIPMAIPMRQLGMSERGTGRVSRAQRALLERGMSDRERAILNDVDRFRFLTSRQIEQLHFNHITTPQAAARICNRVLKVLYGFKVLDHLDRRIGGVRAGSASYVWVVGPVGERLIRADADVRIRRKEPSLHFMRHCLAIADCVIALQANAGHTTYVIERLETEPVCWRSYLGRSGGAETLKPDLALLTTQGDFEDSWFIEIDRGTESIPTLVKKCRQYLAYRQTGQEQLEREVFPLVLWLLPTQYRIDRLQGALATARGVDSSIFRFTTLDAVATVVGGGAA